MSEVQAADVGYNDGARAVELARESLKSYVLHGQREQPGSMRDSFYARTGVLVRIKSTRGRGRLRGCAGTYNGSDQLGHAIVDSTIQAASKNSCGSEIQQPELSNLTISVCIVGDTFTTEDPATDLTLGSHGVAIQAGDGRSWLYPTVPLENGWHEEKFLSLACRKAGISPLAWQNNTTDVTLFDGQVFRERADGGSVEEVNV
ncbi:MAG: uncharacterized protein, PH0010 family [Haloquadratum sp. J07HQX50]|jgi:uncharacterized protein (TIGR00296 family)|nr:MAG: uncharacterized protein, PH0010 family [Haloquadratum sp. J07HQX50]